MKQPHKVEGASSSFSKETPEQDAPSTFQKSSCASKLNKPLAHRFNPYELSLIGRSGSGKTTLATRLIERWTKERHATAYIKQAKHNLEFDREGKDTDRARQSGASIIFAQAPGQQIRIDQNPEQTPLPTDELLHADRVLIETYQHLDLPKIALLDSEGTLLDDLLNGRIEGVVACAGTAPTCPELNGRIPYFHRDDIDGIAQAAEETFRRMVTLRPLYGLILTGGQSVRMGRDKAALSYGNQTPIEQLHERLTPLCDRVFVSTRKEQADDPSRSAYPQIHDTFLNMGPLSGILSAQKAHPRAAWLVVACDLPFLSPATLNHLIKSRNPYTLATAFTSSVHPGLPEPLCAIYEPKSIHRLLQYVARGMYCPRKVLIQSRTTLLAPIEEHALDNINRPDEYQAALEQLNHE